MGINDEELKRLNASIEQRQPDAGNVIAAVSDEVAGEHPADITGSVLGRNGTAGDEVVNILGNNSEPHGYEDFTYPEDGSVDKYVLKSATMEFRKLGLSQKQAQGVVDMSRSYSLKLLDAQQRQWDKMTADWAREIREDAELGGFNYHQTIARAERVLKRFDRDGALTQFLINTRAGNHSALIRFLVNIDNTLSEDGFEMGGRTQSRDKLADEDIFFPTK